ncbi:MAG TPA: hypothetical protein VIL29_10380 [Pseudothermotoga sp.]|uniref:hypothetical protein n=1 Tax=Thermotoga profunda TaxID=1508420 RepID=UPI0005977815|nr:hypothetical protein [Thermotoga profunda]
MDDVLQEIVNACIEDRRIFEIVQAVAKMTVQEREQFESKVKNYYLSRTDQVDLQAYQFYTFILSESNAQRIVEIVSSRGLCV